MIMATAQRRVKTKIKPPKRHGPEVSVEETLSKLSNNIREIHKHNASNQSFEENYRFAYNMVLWKQGDMLYRTVNTLVAENIDSLAKENIIPVFPTASNDDPVQQGQEGETLLKAVRNVWDDHTGNMSKLRDILKYMDRVYTKSAEVPEIWDAGINLFFQRIMRSPIRENIISSVLQQIHIDRDGYVINRSAVKGCVDILLQLNADRGTASVYKVYLEPAILKETELYYQAEGNRLLTSCDASEYLRKVEARFKSETERTHHYLSAQSELAVRKILEDHLLTPHLWEVINMPNSGLDSMIDLRHHDNLARLYSLYTMVPAGLLCLRKALKDSIIRRGKEINLATIDDNEELNGHAVDEETDQAGDSSRKKQGKRRSSQETLQLALKWVQYVLDLKDKLDKIWVECFNSNRDIETSFTEAFEDFVNANDKAPEFVSLFIDENLKKGLKGKTDAEVDTILDKTILVFRYIVDKDVFERYYKGHLAKRLLNGRSVSDDAERGMLAKLKVECGFQFTQKLEGMFYDMKVSEDHMTDYRKYLENVTPPEVDISVIIATATYWPISQTPLPCIMPEQLMKAAKSYEQFYLAKHSGRILTWQPTLGNADVRAQFKSRKHDLNVSTLALVVLLLFENVPDGEFLTYEEIKATTSIPDTELQRQLQSLACGSARVLKKHPTGRDVNPTDSFSFNSDFTSKFQRVKISTVSAKVENTEERKETMDRVDEERKFQTDACIVRIMKDRKHMIHSDLVNEVTRQLATRFQPNPLNIKKRIEVMIEREYLERCADRKSYNYLA